jgi:glycosyltransferase involved in cell wall biosynthesis
MGVIAPWPALAGIKKRLFLRMLRNQHLRHLLTIDEPLVEYLSRHHKTSCKAIFFPEPIGWSDLPDIRDAKKQLGVPLHRKLILVYGAITERKGVEELLQAMNSAEFPSSVDVLLAGKQSPKIRELIRESWTTALVAQRKLICLDRFVEGSEEPCLFAAADIVWLGYREHYTSSGVLAQAVGADRPIIACKEGIIGWQAERHKLGAVISTTEIHEIIAGINAILSEEDSHGERRHFRPCSDISTACDSLKDALHSRLSR